MIDAPKISIITPSFNQGQFIEDTVRSVLYQDYPDFEHIIIDGGSTDNTFEILNRYPHLNTISEPDSGQAHAVNKGLRMATGEVFGWLNADDTYLRGIFYRVISEIKPAENRYVVMGRCAYIDESGNFSGIEHPSMYESHTRCIKIWKGYTIPQPAVFFHREVFERCGGPDESLYFALDYDLFLRYTKYYRIYSVDELWATYRLHANSKTNELSEGELLEKSIEISRRYWGSPASASYLKYLGSYLWFGGRPAVLSLKRLNVAEKAFFGDNNTITFLANLFLSFILFPPTIIRRLMLPRVRTFLGLSRFKNR